MMKTAIVGYPRIGTQRELKFLVEDYLNHNITKDELEAGGKEIRLLHWNRIAMHRIDFIPSNDFSYYDNLLDTAFLFNIIPKRYQALETDPLDSYFAMARGCQCASGDVTALPMKKWFNTNYHYIVPEFEDTTTVCLSGKKPLQEFAEALEAGIKTKPVIIGPFTLLKLSNFTGSKQAEDFAGSLITAYQDLMNGFRTLEAEWLQLDEPALVMDLTEQDKRLFITLYSGLLRGKGDLKILLQTYFGDIRDIYKELIQLGFDGIGLDFIEGGRTIKLLEQHGFPSGILLFAGLVNGKNIWRNSYETALSTLDHIAKYVAKEKLVISSSCSLLHVPYTLEQEPGLPPEYKKHLAFAEEKLSELSELSILAESPDYGNHPICQSNQRLMQSRSRFEDAAVKSRISKLAPGDFTRLPAFEVREAIQRQAFQLPLLPTTTIGSFPQTSDVKSNRAKFKRGERTEAQYTESIRSKITQCIRLQEEIGLDVLVHGEYERNDMVEFFGEHLSGFLFTSNAWVQSYGTRCVKPPIIWSDIRRSKPITIAYSRYAQSLTKKPVKGMLTGPITILNWSFPREDISYREMAFQIALAIRDEVLELEKNGIRIIQIDEAALKEKLPIRREDWHTEYLDWAIPAFRLVHSGVKADTQIHTHMCYSEFGEILKEIDEMDADVISFEASRSQLSIVDALYANGFQTQVGPGVYDIHSPRIPSEEEITRSIDRMLSKISQNKLWINPDCGLKTRGEAEIYPSLKHLVAAARAVRNRLEAHHEH